MIKEGIKMIDDIKLILNAKIYTMNSSNDVEEALVIKNDKIAYIGNNEGAEKFLEQNKILNYETFDLDKRTVLPGLIDSHIHPPGTALTQLYEVSLYGLSTVLECQNAIEEFIKRNPNIDAVYGKGWSLGIFEAEELSKGPKKEHLDEISREIPIILRAYDGHTLWLNSKAFEKYQITSATIPPDGGKIELNDETGELWGTLKESATHLVEEGSYSSYQYKRAFELFQESMHSLGITSILALAGLSWGIQPEVYRELIDENKLKMRISAGFSISPEINPIEQIDIIKERKNKFDSKYFKTTTVKFLADGVVEGATASLIEPYELGAGKGSDYRGEFLWNRARLLQAVDYSNKNGFSIHVHSVGDNATKAMLDVIEEVSLNQETSTNEKINTSKLNTVNEDNRVKNYRNALTHLQIVRPQDIDRFKALNVIASVQPYWHMKGPNWWDVVDYKLIGDRAKYEYPLNSFVKAGVKIASSSDHSVTPIPNPFFAIQAGVTRNLYNASYFGERDVEDIDEERWLLNKDERVSIEDMVRSFTTNGAYLIFRDDEIGSLEVGKYADFIVLDRDVFEIDKLDIQKTKVIMTFFDGALVYKR